MLVVGILNRYGYEQLKVCTVEWKLTFFGFYFKIFVKVILFLFYTLYYLFREIQATLPGWGYSSHKSSATQSLQVHARSFRASVTCEAYFLWQMDMGSPWAQIWVHVHTKGGGGGGGGGKHKHQSCLKGTEKLFLTLSRQGIEPRAFGF